jgi:hypothetical protein
VAARYRIITLHTNHLRTICTPHHRSISNPHAVPTLPIKPGLGFATIVNSHFFFNCDFVQTTQFGVMSKWSVDDYKAVFRVLSCVLSVLSIVATGWCQSKIVRLEITGGRSHIGRNLPLISWISEILTILLAHQIFYWDPPCIICSCHCAGTFTELWAIRICCALPYWWCFIPWYRFFYQTKQWFRRTSQIDSMRTGYNNPDFISTWYHLNCQLNQKI